MSSGEAGSLWMWVTCTIRSATSRLIASSMAHLAASIAASEPSTPTTTGADAVHMIQLLSVPWRGYPFAYGLYWAWQRSKWGHWSRVWG